MRLVPPQMWGDRGACVGRIPAEVFFPVSQDEQLDALEVVRPTCLSCPVYRECHAWALAAETEGIWAATTPAMRRRLRRARNLPTPTHTTATDLVAVLTESTAS